MIMAYYVFSEYASNISEIGRNPFLLNAECDWNMSFELEYFMTNVKALNRYF